MDFGNRESVLETHSYYYDETQQRPCYKKEAEDPNLEYPDEAFTCQKTSDLSVNPLCTTNYSEGTHMIPPQLKSETYSHVSTSAILDIVPSHPSPMRIPMDETRRDDEATLNSTTVTTFSADYHELPTAITHSLKSTLSNGQIASFVSMPKNGSRIEENIRSPNQMTFTTPNPTIDPLNHHNLYNGHAETLRPFEYAYHSPSIDVDPKLSEESIYSKKSPHFASHYSSPHSERPWPYQSENFSNSNTTSIVSDARQSESIRYFQASKTTPFDGVVSNAFTAPPHYPQTYQSMNGLESPQTFDSTIHKNVATPTSTGMVKMPSSSRSFPLHNTTPYGERESTIFQSVQSESKINYGSPHMHDWRACPYPIFPPWAYYPPPHGWSGCGCIPSNTCESLRCGHHCNPNSLNSCGRKSKVPRKLTLADKSTMTRKIKTCRKNIADDFVEAPTPTSGLPIANPVSIDDQSNRPTDSSVQQTPKTTRSKRKTAVCGANQDTSKKSKTAKKVLDSQNDHQSQKVMLDGEQPSIEGNSEQSVPETEHSNDGFDLTNGTIPVINEADFANGSNTDILLSQLQSITAEFEANYPTVNSESLNSNVVQQQHEQSDGTLLENQNQELQNPSVSEYGEQDILISLPQNGKLSSQNVVLSNLSFDPEKLAFYETEQDGTCSISEVKSQNETASSNIQECLQNVLSELSDPNFGLVEFIGNDDGLPITSADSFALVSTEDALTTASNGYVIAPINEAANVAYDGIYYLVDDSLLSMGQFEDLLNLEKLSSNDNDALGLHVINEVDVTIPQSVPDFTSDGQVAHLDSESISSAIKIEKQTDLTDETSDSIKHSSDLLEETLLMEDCLSLPLLLSPMSTMPTEPLEELVFENKDDFRVELNAINPEKFKWGYLADTSPSEKMESLKKEALKKVVEVTLKNYNGDFGKSRMLAECCPSESSLSGTCDSEKNAAVGDRVTGAVTGSIKDRMQRSKAELRLSTSSSCKSSSTSAGFGTNSSRSEHQTNDSTNASTDSEVAKPIKSTLKFQKSMSIKRDSLANSLESIKERPNWAKPVKSKTNLTKKSFQKKPSELCRVVRREKKGVLNVRQEDKRRIEEEFVKSLNDGNDEKELWGLGDLTYRPYNFRRNN